MEPSPLAARLERDESNPTVTAFPDGSVDRFYEVLVGKDRVDTREAFADRIASGRSGVFVRRTAVEPGGHAVNIVTQADRLGNDVTLAGYLDDPVFADLPFEAISMGEPATVSVYGFDDGDVLAVENSAALRAWTLDDLRDVLGDHVEDFLSADAVCCVNWTSIDGLPGALSSLAETGIEGEWFIVDPGSLAGRSAEDVVQFFDALECLTDTYDVVLAGNPREVTAMAARLNRPSDAIDAALDGLQSEAGLSGVVAHGEAHATAATADAIVKAENFDVDASRHTGGGDRFDAGLVHALVREWSWADALRLGNACASWYVATGDAGTPDDLATFLRNRG